MAATVLATPTSAQDGDPGPVDAEALRRQYEDLAGAEADTLVAYDQATARLTELLGQVQAAQEAVAAAEQGLRDAEAALARDREAETGAEAALDRARERVTVAEGRLRAHAVESYMGEGGATSLATFLAVLDGDDGAVARRGYRESISDQQKALVDELVAARREADARSRQATGARRRSQTRRDDVDRLRAAATDALAEQARLTGEAVDEQALQGLLLSDIRARKVSIEARIVSLDKAADGVAQLLAAYQAGDPDWQPGAVDVASPSPGSAIVSEFGQRAHPILNLTRLHAGCDIDAPNGSPVRAAADGVVLLASERGGYGLTVVVAHGSSLGTVYAHNSSISVAVGDRVAQGDELAKVGSTGLSTGPHIHFETRLRGIPVNPRNFLPPEQGGTAPPR
ncbi:MAG TPA: M23 family metallopeptidase [Acidimicrobiales bacterium]|nr:M23 family metallopeptidase [Acidimicrobiales bacterium]